MPGVMQLKQARKADLEVMLAKALCEVSFCVLLRQDIERAAAHIGLKLSSDQVGRFRSKEAQKWLLVRCQRLQTRCVEAQEDAKESGVIVPNIIPV